MGSDVQHILSKGLDSLSLQDVEGVTPRLSESVIASELNRLSRNERNFVLQDIHGVADLVDETPDFVSSAMNKLQMELDSFAMKDCQRNPQTPSAYTMATRQQPTHHQRLDPDVLLSFLRAEQFKVKKAADRIVRYFDEKRTLFGPDKLSRRIRLDDLDEESMTCLQCGRMQLLPTRDR
jgi:hypothetical protein